MLEESCSKWWLFTEVGLRSDPFSSWVTVVAGYCDLVRNSPVVEVCTEFWVVWVSHSRHRSEAAGRFVQLLYRRPDTRGFKAWQSS